MSAAARIIEITDHRLWRIVGHYIAKAVAACDLSSVPAVGLDETAGTRGQNYVTMLIDMQRRAKLVLFVAPRQRKATLAGFAAFLHTHAAHADSALRGPREITAGSRRHIRPGVAGGITRSWLSAQVGQSCMQANGCVARSPDRIPCASTWN